MAKAYNTMSDELSAHLRFINPAYRIASPGTLWSPTRVAAVSCHPVSPELTHPGPGVMARKGTADPPFALIRACLWIETERAQPCRLWYRRLTDGTTSAKRRYSRIGVETSCTRDEWHGCVLVCVSRTKRGKRALSAIPDRRQALARLRR